MEKTIQDYLNGRLSGEDLINFEKEMKINPDLADEIALARHVRRAVQTEQRFDMQKMFADIAAKNPIVPDFTSIEETVFDAPPKPKWWQTKGFWAIGAAAVVFFIAASVVWNQQRQNTERLQKIATDYWTFDRAIVIEADDTSRLAQGLRLFDAKDFGAAAATLATYLAEQKSPDESNFAQLYYGISLALSQQQIKAIKLLDNLAARTDATATSAQWFLALCYLRDGDERRARLSLDRLKNDPVFGVRVQKVLEALNREDGF